MKIDSVLKPKHVAWASGGLLAVILLIVLTRSGAKASVQAPPSPMVEVATVEQRDVPVYGEWIGTLTGQVNADVRGQVTGYLLTRKYKEGSYVRKGELLFEIDPRPFQAALDQAKAQLDQAQAQLIQDEAQLDTAKANELKSQLDRAGILIHLAIGEVEFPFVRICGSVGQDELQFPVIFVRT